MTSAIQFATYHHREQIRKDGRPYINHPLAVMQRINKLNLPKVALKAAVLHDVCEDCEVKTCELNQEFGKRVSFLVRSLTKDPKTKYQPNKQGHNERLMDYLKRLERAIRRDYLVLFIKINDQLDNLRTVDVFNNQKMQRILLEIRDYYLPLYQRQAIKILRRWQGVYQNLLDQINNTVYRKSFRLN